jgi:hypothetical protein
VAAPDDHRADDGDEQQWRGELEGNQQAAEQGVANGCHPEVRGRGGRGAWQSS